MPRDTRLRHLRSLTVVLTALLAMAGLDALLPLARPAQAQTQSPPPASGIAIDELLAAVVRIKTFINPDGRTAETLGREREGTAIVIGSDGLLLTIGYLMVEAHSAEVTLNDGRTVAADIVGYDHETGFGLLRAASALKIRPLSIGKSSSLAVREKVLVAGGGGVSSVGPATVAARRPFAGSWEYLLEDAIFTTPPFPWWSGAALISKEGLLLGVGSLIVREAHRDDAGPGNMFVPVDLLQPILADLIADGRVSGPGRPWLGISTEQSGGRLVVQRVTAGGPAEKAGIKVGDAISGIGGGRPRSLADLYRAVWALGPAGVTVRLGLVRDGAPMELDVKSVNRLDHLKLRSTF